MKWLIGAIVLGLTLAPGGNEPVRADDGDLSFTTSIDDTARIISCSDIDMQFWKGERGRGGIVTVRRDRTLALGPDRSAPLHVDAPKRGGIRVQPSENGSYSVLLCAAAGATSRDKAERILDGVDARFENGELSVRGPSNGDWSAYLVLSVPRDVQLDLTAENGAIGLRGVSGHFTVRTQNGPISVTEVSGQLHAQAVNGPIKFKGSMGNIRLTADNGPINIKLTSPTWTGKGLDASTQNGPVKLSVPKGLRSGVRVEGSGHSPVKWSGNLERAYRDSPDSDSRVIELGSGPILVRLSTVNGPIVIQSAGTSKRKVRI
jgi:hypothetical protein